MDPRQLTARATKFSSQWGAVLEGGDLAAEYAASGIKPRGTIDLQSELQDPYFADTYSLQFDARDVPRARVVTAQ